MNIFNDFMEKFGAWAKENGDIDGAMLVGSYPRSRAILFPDIDLVIIAKEKKKFLDDIHWIKSFGNVKNHRIKECGILAFLRAFYVDGPQVEFYITTAEWAKIPIHQRTFNVIKDGCEILTDKTGMLERLLKETEPQRKKIAMFNRIYSIFSRVFWVVFFAYFSYMFIKPNYARIKNGSQSNYYEKNKTKFYSLSGIVKSKSGNKSLKNHKVIFKSINREIILNEDGKFQIDFYKTQESSFEVEIHGETSSTYNVNLNEKKLANGNIIAEATIEIEI